MTRRTAVRLAWSLWLLSVAFAALTLVFVALGSSSGAETDLGSPAVDALVTVGSLTLPTAGALIAARRPENPIGWIFCTGGLVIAIAQLATEYGAYTLFGDPGAVPGGRVAAWLASVGFFPAFALIGIWLPLLFPDGHHLSRRWRTASWCLALGLALGSVATALKPGPLESPFESVRNPLGLEGAGDVVNGVGGSEWLTLAIGVLVAAASLIVRFRRSRGEERMQLKWVVYAGALLAVGWISTTAAYDTSRVAEIVAGVLAALGFLALPTATVVAIVKYRLYDIDVVINRTLVYGGLTAMLAAAYIGAVLLLGLVLRPLTESSNLAIAGSTLAVAALFRPARSRIQSAVDRRFYRHKYDAARTLGAFSARLRDDVDLDALAAELRQVVAQTMQPQHVSLWLHRRSEARR